MSSRVIGRYRQSNGAVVRCDVEPERPEASSRRGEERARIATSKSGASERSERTERKEAAHEGTWRSSFMMSL